jgi:hypothetical protein
VSGHDLNRLDEFIGDSFEDIEGPRGQEATQRSMSGVRRVATVLAVERKAAGM